MLYEKFWFFLAFIIFIGMFFIAISDYKSDYPKDINSQDQQNIEQAWP